MNPDLLRINHRCQCPAPYDDGVRGKHPPIRVFAAAAHAIKASGILASSTPFESYRCPKCKTQVIFTAGDCGLAST